MKPEISIIGTGALGSTLARSLALAGYTIRGVYNRTTTRAADLADELGTENWGNVPEKKSDIGDLLFLAVVDGAIESVVRQLTGRFDDLSGITVAHCSGNEVLAILKPLKENKSFIAAFHPLQTFHHSSKPDVFQNIYIGLEGDVTAVDLLTEVATRIGARTLQVPAESKPYLHAAAVVACNYMVTLAGMAGEIAEMGGLEKKQVREALHPLMQTTLDNIQGNDLSEVLSGPVARGDIKTVERHLTMLEQETDLLQLYKKLGNYLLRFTETTEKEREEESTQLQKLLT